MPATDPTSYQVEQLAEAEMLKQIAKAVKDGAVITPQSVADLNEAVNQHVIGTALEQGILDRHDAAMGRPSPSPSATDEEQGEVANAYRGRDDDEIVVDVDELNEALHFARHGVNETTAEKANRARRI
jgi:hypothetical protein